METSNPTAAPGLLDDVQPAAPFDMDSMINEAAGTPKQQYDHVFTDPEIPVEQDPEPSGAVQAQARKATAKMLMLMADRAQAGIFTFFGAKGHAEEFRFNPADRLEMAGYLEQGLPENFTLPWWVPFSILGFTQLGVNYGKLQEIREKNRQTEESEAKKKRAELRTEQEQEEALRKKFEQRRNGRMSQAELDERVRAEEEERDQDRSRGNSTSEKKKKRDRSKYQKEYNARRRAARAAKKATAKTAATS